MFKLFTYWRSSTAYRVRIAMNLKGLAYEPAFVSIPKREHRGEDYLAVNPQGLVPALVEDGRVVAQSLAILEFLEERTPEPPLLPTGLHERAYVRALSQVIGCEIHPLNNVRVLRYLEDELGADAAARNAWYRRWIAEGLAAFEAMLGRHEFAGDFCFGGAPTMADVCLVPQIYNARRFDCPLAGYPRATTIAARCAALEPFARAAPERQPDAPAT